MTWVCKKHGKGCKSYVAGFCDELNGIGIIPREVKIMREDSKELMHLVKWVKEAKGK